MLELSSPVGPCFRWSEVRHLKAYKQALQEGRLRKGDRMACCFKGLGMGDHAAVDVAQESHTNLLKSFGAMRDEELLKYRLPMPNPSSKFYEGIMIQAEKAYQYAKLQAHLGRECGEVCVRGPGGSSWKESGGWLVP